MGAAASVREPELPGYIQLHRALPALGAAGVLSGPGQLTRGGPPWHGGRCDWQVLCIPCSIPCVTALCILVISSPWFRGQWPVSAVATILPKRGSALNSLSVFAYTVHDG